MFLCHCDANSVTTSETRVMSQLPNWRCCEDAGQEVSVSVNF